MIKRILSFFLPARFYFLLLVFHDFAVINLSMLISLLLRFDGNISNTYLQQYISISPFYSILAIILFYYFGLYRRLWRYASINELLVIVISSFSATSVLAFMLLYYPGGGFSKGVIAIYLFILTALLGFSRFILRYRHYLLKDGTTPAAPRTLIAGAGDAGQMALREMRRHQGLGIPVGFLDDDPVKKGKQIGKIRVVGNINQLKKSAAKLGATRLVVAMPSAPLSVRKNLVFEAKELGLDVKIFPGVYNILDNNTDITSIRDVELSDLLEREPVEIDIETASSYIREQRVLVTGAGGSIGSEICRQVAGFNPDQLIMLGHGENSIFEAAISLRDDYPQLNLREVIADIRDESRLNEVFHIYKPHVVFHAAAHKHVPLMEDNPIEAVKTNIFGTMNLAKLACQEGVPRFVLISTDKAVNPTSVMGATKRIAEMITLYYNMKARQENLPTKFMAVRFGNVLGSRGSVVPIFKEQIRRGGPVTITHPDMTRYFMTIPEAVQLVIQAGAMGQGGEVFVLDMGKPVRILDLAKDLIRLSGFEPGTDIPIKFNGIRKGEKLYEELLTAEEGTDATWNNRIWKAKVRLGSWEYFNKNLSELEQMTFQTTNHDQAQLYQLLKKLVPTYTCSALSQSAEEIAASEG